MVCQLNTPLENRTGCFKTHFFYPFILPLVVFFLIYISLYIGKDHYDNQFDELYNKKNNEAYLNLMKKENDYHIAIIVISAIELVNIIIFVLFAFMYSINASKIIEKTYKYQIFLLILISLVRVYISLLIPSVKVAMFESIYIRYIDEFPLAFLFSPTGLFTFMFVYITNKVFNNNIGLKDISVSNWHILAILLVVCWRFARSIYNIYESSKFIESSKKSDEEFIQYLKRDNEKWYKVINIESKIKKILSIPDEVDKPTATTKPTKSLEELEAEIDAEINRM
jgi:hypothetical protein